MAKPIWVYLVGAARRIWSWSPERKEVKKNAKNCELCKCKFTKQCKPEIDHKNGVGKAPRNFDGWDNYYKRLFVSANELSALCKDCHKRKTKEERKKMK